ncbi:hypothetical protein AeMF1_006532 [Aphanomyces euteiches]|nr:hypothetical protein AeMF1_006532 [Aphanomyces euteiches]
MRVWILLALAMSAVVAYSQQNRDVAVADQVSPKDSGLRYLRRLKGKTAKDALKPLTLSGRASAKVKGIFGGKKENPKVQNIKGKNMGRVYEQSGNVYQDDRKTGQKTPRSGGFRKNMDIQDFDRVRIGQEPKRTYFSK